MQYILASASPRRRELLSQVLDDFIVDPARGGEEVNISIFPEDIACALAERKCDEVFHRHSGSTVIGCDTIVVFRGEILGKPKDAADAAATLKMLSGKTHYVITGVCVRNKYRKLIKYDKTEVKFNVLSERFINEYVAGGSPLDKAGSYGIQDGGLVDKYYGSYTNVVGLPVALVRDMLREIHDL
ncbi:MAG TPA: septum formation protein Maf [Candidatus Coproplasma avistercoris]|nr:septum formation protein Maf [Candidatus Coproplasma avistercoris]